MKFTQSIFAAAFAFAAAAAFAAPVTTQGVGVGKHGDIQVAVTFDNGKIQKIDILKNAENPVLAKKGLHGFEGPDRCCQLSAARRHFRSNFHVEGFIRCC